VINVFDIETFEENENIIPYCICGFIEEKKYICYYENEYYDIIFNFFLDISLNSNSNKISLYVHNINFDGPLILDSLSKKNIFFDWIIKDMNIYSITFKILECFFEIKCSYKIIPIPLKDINKYDQKIKKEIFPYKFSSRKNVLFIGECPDQSFFNSYEEYIFFIEHKKIFDFKKESIKYCFNDIFLTVSLIKNIRELFEKDLKIIFDRSLSSPSMAYKIFFKKFNEFKISRNISKQDSIYIRNSYYGGRCEVFGNPKIGDYINFFDFSGMYGMCMKEKFPTGNGYFLGKNKDFNKIGFHTIVFESDIEIPVLPYREDKLIFPNGKMLGTYWYEEIIKFNQKGGKVLDVLNSYVYEKEEKVFEKFIDYFNIFRQKKGYHKIFGKLIINSLYGGFALDEGDTITVLTFSEDEFYTIISKTNVTSWYNINNCTILNVIKDSKSNKIFNKNSIKWSNENSSRNVSYASIIASKARIKLYNAIDSVYENNGRVLYCDTDSIFASFKEDKKGTNIGDIKWTETYKDAFFIAPKFYGFIDEKNKTNIKIKGINKNNYSFKDIKDNFFKEKNFYMEFEDQLNIQKKKIVLKQKYIKKNIKILEYNKRIFTDNKINTKPIIIKTTL